MDLSKIFMQTLPNLKILISFERLADLWDQRQFLKQASGLGIQKANYLKKKKKGYHKFQLISVPISPFN